jgi:hypothetical protein
MRHSAATVTTRPLHVITRELRELRNRRDSNGGEDPGYRWRREMLEMEEARAREKEAHRNLTDYEAVQQVEYLQQLVANESATINARISNQERLFVDALGEALSKSRRKMREDIMRHVDEQLAKLRTGPKGERGETGAKGAYGARGPEGKEGPRGKPGPTVEKWEIDRAHYSAWPVVNTTR